MHVRDCLEKASRNQISPEELYKFFANEVGQLFFMVQTLPTGKRPILSKSNRPDQYYMAVFTDEQATEKVELIHPQMVVVEEEPALNLLLKAYRLGIEGIVLNPGLPSRHFLIKHHLLNLIRHYVTTYLHESQGAWIITVKGSPCLVQYQPGYRTFSMYCSEEDARKIAEQTPEASVEYRNWAEMLSLLQQCQAHSPYLHYGFPEQFMLSIEQMQLIKEKYTPSNVEEEDASPAEVVSPSALPDGPPEPVEPDPPSASDVIDRKNDVEDDPFADPFAQDFDTDPEFESEKSTVEVKSNPKPVESNKEENVPTVAPSMDSFENDTEAKPETTSDSHSVHQSKPMDEPQVSAPMAKPSTEKSKATPSLPTANERPSSTVNSNQEEPFQATISIPKAAFAEDSEEKDANEAEDVFATDPFGDDFTDPDFVSSASPSQVVKRNEPAMESQSEPNETTQPTSEAETEPQQSDMAKPKGIFIAEDVRLGLEELERATIAGQGMAKGWEVCEALAELRRIWVIVDYDGNLVILAGQDQRPIVDFFTSEHYAQMMIGEAHRKNPTLPPMTTRLVSTKKLYRALSPRHPIVWINRGSDIGWTSIMGDTLPYVLQLMTQKEREK